MDVKLLPDFLMLPYPALSPKDQLDNEITVKKASSWTYCGPLLCLNAETLPSSFNTWSEASITGSILPPLFSFLTYVHEFLSKNNQSNYWLTIRASKETHDFDIPRWHTDDLFFSSPLTTTTLPTPASTVKRTRLSTLYNILKKQPKSQPQAPKSTTPTPNALNWKLTTTLLGPGTLFIPTTSSPQARTAQKNAKQAARAQNPNHTCLSIRCVGCAMAAESVRETLAAELGHGNCGTNHGEIPGDGEDGIVQAQRGQCVFFRVGEEEGAVHSEPVSHSDRVFVNVVPGSREDLEVLMGRWGMEFPRAWYFGLDFGDLGG